MELCVSGGMWAIMGVCSNSIHVQLILRVPVSYKVVTYGACTCTVYVTRCSVVMVMMKEMVMPTAYTASNVIKGTFRNGYSLIKTHAHGTYMDILSQVLSIGRNQKYIMQKPLYTVYGSTPVVAARAFLSTHPQHRDWDRNIIRTFTAFYNKRLRSRYTDI